MVPLLAHVHWFLDRLRKREDDKARHSDMSPPQWTPAAERSHADEKYGNATFDEYEEAERFRTRYPVEPSLLFPSGVVERLCYGE
jgi:hypothetical protein